MIWRWEKQRLPEGLKDTIIEKRGRVLRHRQFERKPLWKQNSISFRLATRASKEIEEISCAMSITGLKNKYKKIIQLDYQGHCTIRNCFICSRPVREEANTHKLNICNNIT